MAAATSERIREGGRPLRDALYGDLVWSRPGIFRRELDLEAGSERLATLRWEKVFSSRAIAESADGRWIIGMRRSASLLGGYVVRDAATQAEVAIMSRSWRGRGVARFESGAEYRWDREGFWRPAYFWASADGARLITYRSVFGWTRSYAMEVDAAARSLAELPVLVLLGAYVMSIISAQSHAS